MTESKIRDRDLSGITIPGFRLVERRPDLEGPNSQIYLAADIDAAQALHFVKLVDTSDMSDDERERQIADDREMIAFFQSLAPEDASCFVSCRHAELATVDGDPPVQVLIRISDFEPNAHYLSDLPRDVELAAALRDPVSIASIVRDLVHAVRLLADKGWTSAYLNASDLVLSKDSEGHWSARVVYYGSRFVSERHRTIHLAPRSLQALWRIHPDFDDVSKLGEAASVFSLGVVIYQMLTGRIPYHRPDDVVVTEKELRSVTPAPEGFESMLIRMLARKRADRPKLDAIQSAVDAPEFVDELGRVLLQASVDSAEELVVRPVASRVRTPRALLIMARAMGLARKLRRELAPSRAGTDREQRGKIAGRLVADAIRELGPVFIKFGQILATRTDVFAPSFCAELSTLQDSNPAALTFKEVEEIVLKTWRKDHLEDLCLEFSEEPIGVASIGQVHRARLLNGEEVVVKIRKPGIDEVIDEDLQILAWVARRLDGSVQSLQTFRLPEIVVQFDKALRSEIEFKTERLNLQEMALNLSALPAVTVPTVFDALCGDRVLVMGFLKGGIPARNSNELVAAGVDGQAVADKALEMFLHMIFVDGFFHADPHPGNFFVMKDGKIGLIDFGMVGRLAARRRFELLYVLMAVATHSPDRVVQGFRLMGALRPGQDTIPIEQDIGAVLGQLRVLLVKGGFNGLGETLERVCKAVQEHGIRIPPDVFLVIKAVMSFETSLCALSPGMDILASFRGHMMKLMTARFASKFTGKDTSQAAEYAAMSVMDAACVARAVLEREPAPATQGASTPSPQFHMTVRAAVFGLCGCGLAVLVPRLQDPYASAATASSVLCILVAIGMMAVSGWRNRG